MRRMADHAARAKLGRWQAWTVIGTAAAAALALIGIGAAGSYANLRQLEKARHVPLPALQPVGLDGGLVGIIALDLALTWAGYPIWWLRWTARLFAFGTVAANAAAAWPDPLSMALRMADPVLIVIISEAVRAVLLHRHHEQASDRIPGARWLLALPSTFRLWRRMKLWNITSYPAAVDMEIARRHAIEQLTAKYKGKDWRTQAPADLVWMLGAGVRMAEALDAVAELLTPPAATAPATARKRPAATARKPRPATAPAAPVDVGTEAAVWTYLQQGKSASEAGVLAGVSKARGRQIARQLRERAPATGEQPAVTSGDATGS